MTYARSRSRIGARPRITRYARNNRDTGALSNPLTELPLYAGFFADDPAWTDNPGVGQAVSSWRNGGTLAASGAYLDPTLGLVLPGVAGNGASVPDEAALDLTTVGALVVEHAATDWTSGIERTLIVKQGVTASPSATARAHLFTLTSTGLLKFYWWEATVIKNAFSDAAVPFADGATGWCAVSFDMAGGGGRTIKFWTSTDGVTWTQLGTTVTGAASSIDSTSAPLWFGQSLSDGYAGQGAMKTARVYDSAAFTAAGPGGTLVLDVDFRRTSVGAFTCSTGQTVTVASTFNALQATAGSRPTLTTSALLGGRRVVDFDGTDDRLEITTGVSLAQPFEVWWIGVYDSFTSGGTQVGLNSASSGHMTGVNTTPSHRMNMGTTYTTGTPVANTAYLVRSDVNGASSRMYVNGAAGGAANAGALAVDQIIIGAGRTAPSTYAGHLNGKTAFLGILPAASITATHRRQFALWAASFYSVPGFAAAA